MSELSEEIKQRILELVDLLIPFEVVAFAVSEECGQKITSGSVWDVVEEDEISHQSTGS